VRRIQLKISDFADAAEVTRFQVDGFLKEVFSSRPLGKKSSGGSHRGFTPHELLVFVVALEIERKYGVKRNVLASVGEPLCQALTGPRRAASRDSRLLVAFEPPSAVYLDASMPVQEGIVVPLGPLFERVDEFLGFNGDRPTRARPSRA
jgi:hypothetical protein